MKNKHGRKSRDDLIAIYFLRFLNNSLLPGHAKLRITKNSQTS